MQVPRDTEQVDFDLPLRYFIITVAADPYHLFLLIAPQADGYTVIQHVQFTHCLTLRQAMEGRIISHYKILEKIGQGGMGVVYKAEDTQLKRTVALKFLPTEFTLNEEAKARFLQEAQAASALDHPAICTVHGIDDYNGELFIVMGLVEGESLRSKLKRSMLQTKDVIDICIQIAEGLHAAHEKGIVHRDIKSDNIMVTPKGRVKIMDFGLAKLRGSGLLTRTRSTVGTIGYMSPEQIRGEKVDHRTDLWSLGVVLYEMLTGRLPFNGEHEAAIMYEILNVEPKAIQLLRQDVPDNVAMIASLLLQKECTRRLASAGEVAERCKKVSTEKPKWTGEKSLAVLYFENFSPEKDSEYFCAGMTEDIITDLSKIKDLKVVSRTDVLPFRNKEVNIRQVGEALGVNYVLEGSVRKSGNRIRVTAQLIDVKTGFHAWADRFDRLLEDIFEVQNEVSQKIADALKISLTSSEKESIASRPTQDLRAYDFYMRGRDFLSQRGRKKNELAIQMFENAVALDPQFAAAYAGLAEGYVYMYEWYDGSPSWLAKAVEVDQKAISLDQNSLEAQFGLAMVYFHQKRYSEARHIFEKILEEDPNAYEACRRMGMVAEVTGDFGAALEYYSRASLIRPYSEEPWAHLNLTYRRKGNIESAHKAAERVIEVASRKLEAGSDDIIAMSRLACAYAHFGAIEEALATVKNVLELDPADGLAIYNCACAYALLGKKDEALAYLRRTLELGFRAVPNWAKIDPDFESFREDDAFQELLAQFG